MTFLLSCSAKIYKDVPSQYKNLVHSIENFNIISEYNRIRRTLMCQKFIDKQDSRDQWFTISLEGIETVIGGMKE